jgi:hypothetical protein
MHRQRWFIPQRNFTPPLASNAVTAAWNMSVGCFARVIVNLHVNVVDPRGVNHADLAAGNPAAIAEVEDGPQGTWFMLWKVWLYAPPLWRWGSAPGCGSFRNVPTWSEGTPSGCCSRRKDRELAERPASLTSDGRPFDISARGPPW